MAAVRKAIYELGKSKEIQLKDDQKTALELLATGKNVIACLPTGYGKSWIFMLFPLLWDLVSTELEVIGGDYSRNLRYILLRLILKNAQLLSAKGDKKSQLGISIIIYGYT